MGDADGSTIRTTGDSGIGLATARTLRAVGANVVLADHGAERLDGGNRVPTGVSVTGMTSRFADHPRAVFDRPGVAARAAVLNLVGALAPGTWRPRESGATPRSEGRTHTEMLDAITGS
ncbi:hypothetical protein OG936_39190 (plasmid) [Streptomyces sp. NBC_00846]|uniref:hypothetical protein n=1 Tax=Streptomyces sp. NBC_00846 TaxID=2975849 RepID=UPI002F91B6CC|nr:hypothetical protein OG936_39190 [Streptomyces sp. NBC_00846]